MAECHPDNNFIFWAIVFSSGIGKYQDQLAEKCGTTKTYISRIENDAYDIRLSTLMRIIREGFGGNLKLNVAL